MKTVLDGFRDLSRPLSGLRLAEVDLLQLVGDLILLSEGHAESRHIELLTRYPTLAIRCDPPKVKQAILNLLQNSIDATSNHGRIAIEVCCPDSETVSISVVDSGSGLASDWFARPFSPGFTTKLDGSGIGLVVARCIAEQHGGELTLQNGAQGGCVATLTLPRTAAPEGELI